MNKTILKNAIKAAIIKEQADQEPTNQLAMQLKKILADAFVFYFKAQTFHWNVEGKNFPQYHEFFGTVYTTVYGSIDRLAEEIRMLDEKAPISLASILESTNLVESSGVITNPSAMLYALLQDNDKIMVGLTAGYKLAEASGELGLSNYLQDLLDAHKKLNWMIKSTNKE